VIDHPRRTPVTPRGENRMLRKRKMPASANMKKDARVSWIFACWGVAWGVDPEHPRTMAIIIMPHTPRSSTPLAVKSARRVTVCPSTVPHGKTSNDPTENIAIENRLLESVGALPPGRSTTGIARKNAARNARMLPIRPNLFTILPALVAFFL